ncbi:MAG: acyl-CoA desaturase [Actinomycetota bacterium]|nr:acyl-CoA desaturase [Actinomycetota bacterium]
MDQSIAAPTVPDIPGIAPLTRGQLRAQRMAVIILTIAPFAGMILAITLLWGRAVSAVDLALFGAMYVVSGLGITVGYHRLLTHRSFDTPKSVRATFAVCGSLAVEGSVISWVADHRRHHAFADKEGDPHSPHLEEREGLLGTIKGLWHAHIGWLTDEVRTEREKWAPDMLKDPMMVKIDRMFGRLTIVSLVLPAVIGLVVTQSWAGAVSAFFWGGLARVFLLHHVTWSVNSICHYFGRRPFETTDKSTNNWPLAIISFGESWHNNHHAFPTSAVHGIRKGQIDPGGMLIAALEKLKLAYNVHRPSQKQLVGKLRADS